MLLTSLPPMRSKTRRAGLGQDEFSIFSTVIDAAAKGYSAYSDYDKAQQQEEALKQQQDSLATQLQIAQDNKATAMAQAQAAQATINEAKAVHPEVVASALQSAAPASGISTATLVVGGVAAAALAVVLMGRKKR